jgi:hypothetical protein
MNAPCHKWDRKRSAHSVRLWHGCCSETGVPARTNNSEEAHHAKANGRILSQTVIPSRSLSVRDEREVLGFSFTPRDGNPLLSSSAAAAWFLHRENNNCRLQCIEKYIFQEI